MNIETVINAYFENLSAMNPQGWLTNFAEDAVIYDPVGSPASFAHQDVDKFFGLLSNLFQELKVTQDHQFLVGNQAAAKWTMNVIGKNGKKAVAEGISIFEMNEAGKIKQLSSYWDESKLIAQLKTD